MRFLECAIVLSAMALAGCDSVAVEELGSVGQKLCAVDFDTCVNPIFDATLQGRTGPVTCAASGCHAQDSGSGGAFKIFPNAGAGSVEAGANYFAARGFANLADPSASKLLLEPLQGISSVTGTHTGGDIFPDTGDACYVAIHEWINKRVDASDSESCGGCVAPDVETCGY